MPETKLQKSVKRWTPGRGKSSGASLKTLVRLHAPREAARTQTEFLEPIAKRQPGYF
jgi:hypothetical protein